MINNALHVDVVDFFKVAFTTRDEYQCCCVQSCPQTVTTYVDKEVTCCVPVTTKEKRKCMQQVRENVEEEKEIECCVPIMVKEKRIGKKTVCEPVTETKEYEVCIPVTTYETKEVSSYCRNSCGCCNQCCTKTVQCPVTTYKKEMKTSTCTRMVSKCVDYEYEVCTTKMEKQMKKVTVCHWVTKCVEKEYEVNVRKMETQTKIIKVAVCSKVCGGCKQSCC